MTVSSVTTRDRTDRKGNAIDEHDEHRRESGSTRVDAGRLGLLFPGLFHAFVFASGFVCFYHLLITFGSPFGIHFGIHFGSVPLFGIASSGIGCVLLLIAFGVDLTFNCF